MDKRFLFPDKNTYDKRLTKFWEESYEYALHNYARLDLSVAIDEHFNIDDALLRSLDDTDVARIRISLDRFGLLESTEILPDSSEALLPAARQSIKQASTKFPVMPEGSPSRTNFNVRFGKLGAVATAELFFREDELISRIQDVFFGSKLVLGPCNLIKMRRTGTVIERAPTTNVAQSAVEQFRSVLSREIDYPEDFPTEVRFALRPGTGIFRFFPGFLSSIYPDAYELRRNQRNLRVLALDEEPRFRSLQSQLSAGLNAQSLQDLSKYAAESGKLQQALNIFDDYAKKIDASELADIWMAKISTVSYWAHLTHTYDSHAEQIIEYCRKGLQCAVIDGEMIEDLWSRIGLVAAHTGRLNIFKEAYSHLKCSTNKEGLHSAMGNWLAAEGDWVNALDQFELALKHFETLPEDVGDDAHNMYLENTMFACQYCRDQLEPAMSQ